MPQEARWVIKNTKTRTLNNNQSNSNQKGKQLRDFGAAFSDKGFRDFIIRFLSTLIILTLIYEAYLWFTEQQRELDWVTYKVSELSHALATALGVANCEFSCFMDGCRIGVEGRMINVIEGCNGLMLALVYASYIVGSGGVNTSSLVQVIVGIIVVQFFNVLRIGMLVVLQDIGGDAYFYFVKYIFNALIYLSILFLWILKPYVDKALNRQQ